MLWPSVGYICWFLQPVSHFQELCYPLIQLSTQPQPLRSTFSTTATDRPPDTQMMLCRGASELLLAHDSNIVADSLLQCFRASSGLQHIGGLARTKIYILFFVVNVLTMDCFRLSKTSLLAGKVTLTWVISRDDVTPQKLPGETQGSEFRNVVCVSWLIKVV